MSKEDFKYCSLITIITGISYFQLVFGIFSTKWDNLSAFFPYRYTAMHWWRNGHIPFWDPYQNLGYPMHANPQGAVWYPITWLFGLIQEYSIYSLNLELVFHIILAGIGMYFLLKHSKLLPVFAFVGAITFGLSGFISSTSHMIGFTAGAAWLPWALLYISKSIQSTTFKNLSGFSIITYLHLTGAYTAFSINIVYIYILFVLFKIMKSSEKVVVLSNSLKVLLFSGGLTLLLAGPYIYSILDSLQYFSRATSLEYNSKAFESNFSWQAFQSLCTPYVISAKEGFSGLDVSMSNLFVGIPSFLLSLAYFFLPYNPNKKYVLTALLVSTLLGLGNHTPLHQIIFSTIPGVDLYRHPYLFMVYSTLILSYCGAYSLEYLYENRRLHKPIIPLFICSIIVLLVLLAKVNYSDIELFYKSIINLRERSPLNNYGHAAIQLLFFVLGLSFLVFIRQNKTILITVLVFEMVVAIQLNSPLHMYYNVPLNTLENYLEETSNSNLTNQDAGTPLDCLRNSQIPATPGFWVNLNTYKRTTGIDGYNPFIYSSFESLQSEDRFQSLIRKGIVYSSDTTSIIQDLKIGFNSFSFQTKNLNDNKIYIQQNFHHNWSATVDSTRINIQRDNNGLMSIALPPGNKTVELNYRNDVVVTLLILSIITIISLITSLVFISTRQ